MIFGEKNTIFYGEKHMRILNFGSCNIDTVYSVKHIVQAGETLGISSLNQFPGGKGLNQSIALARAGVKVYHAGCVGKEDMILIPLMQKAGIDVTHLKKVERQTGQAFIQLDENGQNAILVYPGANAAVTKEYIDEVLDNFEEGDILLIQNEISNTLYLIEKAAEKGMRIILNPSPFTDELRKIDLNKLYCVILNETEAAQWTRTGKPYDFITYVYDHYKELKVILTLGRSGSIYLDNQTIYRQFAYKLPAIDTTAAGDTFTGYFVAGLYRGENAKVTLKNASAASALAVSREGAATSIPKLSEVLECVNALVPNINENFTEQKELVRTYILCNIADIKLKDVASILGYTEAHTSRWIRKNFGMNFSEFIQNERCEMAAELLRNSRIPIGEIIYKVGYQNETFFRNVFMKKYNISPGAYRKQETEKRRGSNG